VYLALQSCTTYRVLPKNISHHSSIEGVYSNISTPDTSELNLLNRLPEYQFCTENVYRISPRRLWDMFDHKAIKADGISVKVEIAGSKALIFSFIMHDEVIGAKRFKGKFKTDECFYTRRRFMIFPLFPIVVGWLNYQERFYRVDNELIVEMVGNQGGVAIFFASGDVYNDIWKFKRLDK
jgi:hypothetical protein